MSIEEITNFILVSEQIASSGQPEEHQFKIIANANYQLVINLAMPNSENAIPEEGNIVAACKMNYVHIPVPFDAPNVDHLRKFIKIMSCFSNEKIWVHCVVNYRVSAFLYHYQRVAHGMPEEAAKMVILPSWQPNDVWQRFMALTPNEIAL
jgi:protein tyrosine phosphatase (PTP) superfamily phosphohydrolase (DUF442 family)